MTKKTFWLAIFVLTVGAFLALPPAQAYVLQYCDDGTNVRYPIDPDLDAPAAHMFISTTSFPPGSASESLIRDAMVAWSDVDGSDFVFVHGQDTDGTHDSDNGRNEVYFDDDDADDFLARTMSRYDCDAGEKVESDIAFNTGYVFSTSEYDYSNPTGSPYNMEGVALHEFGHVLGLGHEDDLMATMNSLYPLSGPFGFYKEWEPFGDDLLGTRYLYPDSTTETDLAASPLQRTGAGQSGLVDSPASASPGSSVTIEFTFSNVGTTKQTFDIGFYLSTNDYISTGDRLLGTNVDAWGDPGFTGTFSRTVTIPSDIAPGTYYLGFRLDDHNEVPETNGGNNVQPMPRSITIN